MNVVCVCARQGAIGSEKILEFYRVAVTETAQIDCFYGKLWSFCLGE